MSGLSKTMHSLRSSFPATVCHAFSLELYLKYSLLMEGSPPPITHDLKKGLFELLSKERKAEIERDTDVAKQQEESVRYIHEKTALDDGEVWSAQAVMLAVRKRLCVIHPEWENFQFVTASQRQVRARSSVG